MKTREIPREQWNNLFLMLTRELAGEPVRLEVVGKELGDQPMAEQVPLREVVLDKRGRGGREIDVMVGRDEDPFEWLGFIAEH